MKVAKLYPIVADVHIKVQLAPAIFYQQVDTLLYILQ